MGFIIFDSPADEYLADFTEYKPGRPNDAVFALPELCAISPKAERHSFPTVAFQMGMLLPSTRHSEPPFPWPISQFADVHAGHAYFAAAAILSTAHHVQVVQL